MIDFWQDKEKGIINPKLFSEVAEELAKEIDKYGRYNKQNNKSQIMKFYHEVLEFKRKIDEEPSKFNNFLPYIKILNAKAAYAKGRGLISDSFKEFISNSLKKINDYKDFEIFTNFFEAFIGYYKFYTEKKGRDEK